MNHGVAITKIRVFSYSQRPSYQRTTLATIWISKLSCTFFTSEAGENMEQIVLNFNFQVKNNNWHYKNQGLNGLNFSVEVRKFVGCAGLHTLIAGAVFTIQYAKETFAGCIDTTTCKSRLCILYIFTYLNYVFWRSSCHMSSTYSSFWTS